MPDPYRFFRIEAAELTNALETGLLELERGTATPEAAVANVLRHAHTLKGAARVVRHDASATLAHAIEDILIPVREGTTSLSPNLVTRALALVDTLRGSLSELMQPSGSAETAALPRTTDPQPKQESSLEVPARPRAPAPAHRDTVNHLLETATAIGAELARLDSARSRLGRARRRAASQADYPALPTFGATSLAVVRSTDPWQDEIARTERELSTLAEVSARQLRELREGLERLRLVESDDLRGPLERTARDTALSVGKRVHFEFHGGGLRIEPELHAAMAKALLQAVKNAVVHGIEPPELRSSEGKPTEGHVVVKVEGQGSAIVFSCEDDGRGLDLEAVRRVVTARSTPGAPPPSESALIEALLSGGVSTASNVTAVAGRGIGLDLVRDAAESVGATLRLRHRPGHGVHLAVVAKAELAAFPALLVEAAGIVYALPIDALSETTRHEIAASPGAESGVVRGGKIAPFIPLTILLDNGARITAARKTWTVVVLKAGEELLALGVDRLLGTESVVVQPIPEAAQVNPALVGISSAIDGSARFLLDAKWLHDATRNRGGGVAMGEAPPPLVLVIDDSLTTRMLERSILESAGYEVDMATSGEEGLAMARAKSYALFLVDVEMPGIDGFTFIETTQADADLRRVPAILVTSRNAPEDLARGVRVGARGHVVKSEFDQVELLQLIERLVAQA